MAQPLMARPSERDSTVVPGKNEAYSHGVSWPAVIGGAFAAASLSLILLTLGTGLGFSSVSPWSNTGVSANAVGTGAIVWVVVTQILASAMGGYLAGRLRAKWTGVHTHEVYFRDTAHGFLVWAVGMVITAAFLTSAAASFAGSAERSPTNVNGAQDAALDPNAYFVDTLLRSNGTAAETSDAYRGEVARTFAHALKEGAMPADDRTYLTQVVSARTGVPPADSEKRVDSVFTDAQEAADKMRKTLARLSLWLFVALLSGAFTASYAGTIGGKQRDQVPVL